MIVLSNTGGHTPVDKRRKVSGRVEEPARGCLLELPTQGLFPVGRGISLNTPRPGSSTAIATPHIHQWCRKFGKLSSTNTTHEALWICLPSPNTPRQPIRPKPTHLPRCAPNSTEFGLPWCT